MSPVESWARLGRCLEVVALWLESSDEIDQYVFGEPPQHDESAGTVRSRYAIALQNYRRVADECFNVPEIAKGLPATELRQRAKAIAVRVFEDLGNQEPMAIAWANGGKWKTAIGTLREAFEMASRNLAALRAMAARCLVEADDAIRVLNGEALAPAPAQANRIVMRPGGFSLGDHIYRLSGKPWEILEAALSAHDNRITEESLIQIVWAGETRPDPVTVRNRILEVRGVLRRALADSNLIADDPFPCINRGKNRAWKLDLPI